MLRFATSTLYFAHGSGTVGIILDRVVEFHELQNCRSRITTLLALHALKTYRDVSGRGWDSPSIYLNSVAGSADHSFRTARIPLRAHIKNVRPATRRMRDGVNRMTNPVHSERT